MQSACRKTNRATTVGMFLYLCFYVFLILLAVVLILIRYDAPLPLPKIGFYMVAYALEISALFMAAMGGFVDQSTQAFFILPLVLAVTGVIVGKIIDSVYLKLPTRSVTIALVLLFIIWVGLLLIMCNICYKIPEQDVLAFQILLLGSGMFGLVIIKLTGKPLLKTAIICSMPIFLTLLVTIAYATHIFIRRIF